MTAISLLFSIMNLEHVPFVILDEVESALDENNAIIFGEYLENYKNKTQLLIITHKKKTMEYLDKLYVWYGFIMEYLPFIIIWFLNILICIFFAICIFSFRFLRFLDEFTEFKNIFKNFWKEWKNDWNDNIPLTN